MNKTKIILAGTGGAIGLVVLVLAFLVWQSFSAKTAALEGDDEEGTEGLESVQDRVRSLSRKAVYPCKESVAALEKNLEDIDDWCKEGLSLATKGDRIYEKTTAPKFKTFLVSDAKRLAELPGAAGGKLVKPDFAFGPFTDYIVGGKMPSEAELAELQRKWDDVATVTELLAANGVAEITDIAFATVAKEEPETAKNAKGKKPVKRNAKAKAQTTKSPHEPRAFSYAFTFAARPAAFIKALNALEASERFITVENFSFSRPSDVIAEALGADEKKESEAAARRGRRGRRDAKASEEKPAAGELGKGGIVTDPLQDAPMTVTMTVTVCDFRSLEKEQAEEEGK